VAQLTPTPRATDPGALGSPRSWITTPARGRRAVSPARGPVCEPPRNPWRPSRSSKAGSDSVRGGGHPQARARVRYPACCRTRHYVVRRTEDLRWPVCPCASCRWRCTEPPRSSSPEFGRGGGPPVSRVSSHPLTLRNRGIKEKDCKTTTIEPKSQEGTPGGQGKGIGPICLDGSWDGARRSRRPRRPRCPTRCVFSWSSLTGYPLTRGQSGCLLRTQLRCVCLTAIDGLA